jgi:hypothetical protein
MQFKFETCVFSKHFRDMVVDHIMNSEEFARVVEGEAGA